MQNAKREDPGPDADCPECRQTMKPVYTWGYNSWVICDWKCGCW